MQTIVNAGLERAFTLDLIGATKETANCSVEDTWRRSIVRSTTAWKREPDRRLPGRMARDDLRGAQSRAHHTLTIAGAPIDFHAGEPVIGDVLGSVRTGRPPALLRGARGPGGGVLKGRHMLSGFIMIQPGAEVSRQLELALPSRRSPAHLALSRVRGLVY